MLGPGNRSDREILVLYKEGLQSTWTGERRSDKEIAGTGRSDREGARRTLGQGRLGPGSFRRRMTGRSDRDARAGKAQALGGARIGLGARNCLGGARIGLGRVAMQSELVQFSLGRARLGLWQSLYNGL